MRQHIKENSEREPNRQALRLAIDKKQGLTLEFTATDNESFRLYRSTGCQKNEKQAE
jgi:hypothetical protein